MFELASRLKLRWESTRGSLSVEDLWELPLQTQKANGLSLDQIALALHRLIRDSSETSFVTDSPKTNADLQLRFDIVKHIIEVKKAENAAARSAQEREQTKQRIHAILEKKKDERLEAASEEELLQMLKSL